MQDLTDTPDAERRAHQGAGPTTMRDHNERAILSILRDRGALAKSQIAQALNFSAQTASVILRSLEQQDLVRKCEPRKGKIGKPQTPLAINGSGAYAFGLRLGRRNADLVLIDLAGDTIAAETIHYTYPTPAQVEAFCKEAMQRLHQSIPRAGRNRIVGLGIATPFELWNWLDALGADPDEALAWKGYDFAQRFARFTDLPVHVVNDVNLACTGELLFGVGQTLQNFLYFYVGAFVGGALVLDGRVFQGAHGNAGAFGSIPTGAPGDPDAQLIATASLSTLERTLTEKLGRPVNIRAEDEIWTAQADTVSAWMQDAARSTARAALSVVAALDVATVVIDGIFPEQTRTEFGALVEQEIAKLDMQGIRPPRIVEGALGATAGPRGAAYHPLLVQFFAEGSGQNP